MSGKGLIKTYGKPFFIYAIIFGLLLGLTGLLQWVDVGAPDTYYYFAQALIFIFGIAHVFMVRRLIPQISPDDFWNSLFLTVLIFLVGIITAAAAYHFIGLDYRFLTYILPFFIPFFCWYVFRVFFQIPSRVYKAWYYPLNEPMPDLDMIDLSQIAVVQFVFSKNAHDTNQINFTAKAPLNMTLGQLFFIFINDYNDKNVQHPIQYLQSPDQPYGWLFYRKRKWFAKKDFFDSERSFLNNHILPNEFIFADRVI
ncbi:MAG TPA: TssN family type VI secretion system protein [Puia sp.]